MRTLQRLSLIAALVIGTGVVVYPSIPASDNFNRANGGLGTNWTAQSTATLAIASNAVFAGVADDFPCAKWATATDTFSNDQSSQVTIATINIADSLSVVVRGSNSFATADYNGYLLTADGNTFSELVKVVNGAGSQLVDLSAVSWTAGDTAKITVQGTTIKGYKNGVEIVSTTDSALATGQPGMCIFDSSSGGSSNISLDDWVGDNIASGGSTVRRLMTTGMGERP